VSPEAVAPNSFVLLSLNLLNAEGNKMFYRVGTGETLALDTHKNIIIQAPSQVGTAEIAIVVTDGRQDVVNKLKLRVDDSLPASTIRYGRATLPIGKSFDFFTGSVVDGYYGDIDYGYYYGTNKALDFSGNRNGSPRYSFDGGLINLTAINGDIKELNQVVERRPGTYYQLVDERASEGEYKLQVGSVYCFWLKYENDFFGKIKIISFDDEKIIFDWVLQKTPGERKFYDYAPSVLAATPPAAPTGLVASASNTTVILSWESVKEPDLAGYWIYRSTTSGSGFSKIKSVGLVNSITDVGLSPNTTYYYKIKAIDSVFNESEFSSEISVTTGQATTEIFSDDAERGLANWQASGFTLTTEESYSPTHSFYSGKGNNLNNTLTLASPILIPSSGGYLWFKYYCDIENGYDYLYVEASEDKSEWSTITYLMGSSGGWNSTPRHSLGRYSGKSIYLRFRYVTDNAVSREGAYIDDIVVGQ